MDDMRIQRIQEIIDRQQDEDLQTLFQWAFYAKISSALIIRIWYGQVNLRKQPPEIIDFLSKALHVNDVINDTTEPEQEHEEAEDEPVELSRFRQNKLAFTEDESVPVSARKRCNAILRDLEALEVKYNKDIAEMSKEEFADVFSQIGVYNRQYISMTLNLLKHYFKWSLNTGRPTHEYWTDGEIQADDIDLSVAIRQCCFASPESLYYHIVDQIDLDSMFAAPPLAVLAWMGFSVKEAIDIKNDEIDLARHEIRGRKIPNLLINIINRYYQVGDSIIEVPIHRGTRRMRVNDIGYFIKTKTALSAKQIPRFSVSSATTALSQCRISYKDIDMSARYYRLHEIERTRRITKADICEVFEIEIDDPWREQQLVNDRLIEYYAYVQAFHKD